MKPILLTTLNAKYIHASLGLRALRANLGELRDQSLLVEYTIRDRATDIAERILAMQPTIIGFGVYIWNAVETLRVVRILKAVRPEIRVVLGGPEVSYETEDQLLCQIADHVVSGPGDVVFADLCRQILSGATDLPKYWHADPPSLEKLVPPYDEYTDVDIKQRLLYVEASRGCAFKCEFCLSSLDKTAWPFPVERFLDDLRRLRERGAHHFKFVDRTFNLKVDTSIQILDTLLGWIHETDGKTPDLFAHFEVVPDHLPDRLLERMAQFPAGTLQLEIGFQTFNPEVQTRISRRQNDEKALINLKRLRTETQAHLHTDLIFGLPGETLESFAAGFDRLIAMDPHEIQVGILKRLRGAPISRHTAEFELVFDPDPPYAILSTSTADFHTIQRMIRFARFWDLIGNSGRFVSTRALILGDSPFARFMALSDHIYALTNQTHEFAYERLIEIAFDWLTGPMGMPIAPVGESLAADFARSGAKGRGFVESLIEKRTRPQGERQVVLQKRQVRTQGAPANS